MPVRAALNAWCAAPPLQAGMSRHGSSNSVATAAAAADASTGSIGALSPARE
jgi:hypothetical protein